MSEESLRINFILEIIGNPESHVEKTIRLVLDQIDENDEIDILSKDLGDPEETEDDMFAVFADITAEVDDITTVGHIANNYNPASIELVEPDTATVSRRAFNDFFADTLAKHHVNNTQIQKLKGFRKEMENNFNALARNAVILSLEQEDKTKEALAEDVGVSPDELGALLDSMEDENRLRERDGTYTIRA